MKKSWLLLFILLAFHISSSFFLLKADSVELLRLLGYKENYIYYNYFEALSPVKGTHTQKISTPNNVSALPKQNVAMQTLQTREIYEDQSLTMFPVLLEMHKDNPESPKITRRIADYYMKNGKPQEAVHWLIKTYQRDRNDHIALWNIAALSYQIGDKEQSNKFLREYSKADPHSGWGRLAKEYTNADFYGVKAGGSLADQRFGSGFSEPYNEFPDGEIMIIEDQRSSFNSYIK